MEIYVSEKDSSKLMIDAAVLSKELRQDERSSRYYASCLSLYHDIIIIVLGYQTILSQYNFCSNS